MQLLPALHEAWSHGEVTGFAPAEGWKSILHGRMDCRSPLHYGPGWTACTYSAPPRAADSVQFGMAPADPSPAGRRLNRVTDRENGACLRHSVRTRWKVEV